MCGSVFITDSYLLTASPYLCC
uniref:Uncharacterized protein n=1 Tax=Anguilla anguilla TaxID=7936 RepID=A0A0E9SH91_ANGAN